MLIIPDTIIKHYYKKYGKIITINVPVVYMGQDLKMRAISIMKAFGRSGP
jgi:hypothetical protein